MKKQLVIVSALACLFVSKNVSAQEKVEKLEEVVVTATKFSLKKENTGKVIHKITAKDLKNNAGKSVIDVINNVVGIDVRGVNANATEPRSINIRGGRARQVLILIDGVPVSDASLINQEYDLRFLSLNQIENIEILKGGASTLYGSGAAAGVINITLKKASKNKISGGAELSLETNNTANTTLENKVSYHNSASLNGSLGNFNFMAMLGATENYGFSSAKSLTSDEFEGDNFNNTNGLLKLGYNFSNRFSVETFLNYDKFKYDFDAGAFADSDVNKGNQKQVRFGVKPSLTYNNGQIYLLTSVNEVERSLNQFNSFSNTLDNYVFEGRSVNLDLVNKIDFKQARIQLITGLNYQEHENNTVTPFGGIDRNVANFNTIDPYVSAVYISDFGLSVNVGGRLNMHSVYDNKFVYDGNVAYNIFNTDKKSLKVLASYGTAFIAPSTYQLYDGFSGNIDLKPETNKTFEFGAEASFNNFIDASVVYFNRIEEDAIIFDNNTFKYGNGSSDANGIEATINLKPAKTLDVNFAYTYTDRDTTEDFDDYIPRNKFVAAANFSGIKNMLVNLTYKKVGQRNIFDRFGSFTNPGENVVLDSYNVLDLNTNLTILDDKLILFGSVTNLFNEDYDDILGYNTRGRNYKLGLRVQF